MQGSRVNHQDNLGYNGLSTNKIRGGNVNISDVAKRTGLTSKAIRFYEEKGLVTPPLRSENGYRTYNQQHLNELTLLRQHARWVLISKSAANW